MKNSEISDPLFLEAVKAMDSGDISVLESLLLKHPQLVRDRLKYPPEGYFQHPYLLWFVAENPIRTGKLPANIVEITRLIIRFVRRESAENMQQQLDYALGLVSTGRIPKESGVQIKLMDLLIDEGAKPGGGSGALANGNTEAAEHLIKRGGQLTLAVAVGLGRMADVNSLISAANPDELLIALTVAAFYGKPEMTTYLLAAGADLNGYPQNNKGFHSHATPLHQAVASGSLETVKLLVEAGAKLDARDRIYDGTPLDWAQYMPRERGMDESAKANFYAIEAYLKEKENRI